jgi:hypothetical protein
MSFSTRRTIEFIYSATVAYVLVFEEYYVRVFYDGALITTVATPYLEEHLFELQYRQVGDVMRIVHSKYAPRKLSRISATTFTLSLVDFKTGPFQVRNDLSDPSSTSTLTYTGTLTPGTDIAPTYGTLTASNSVFDAEHSGSLWKLTHPKAITTVSAVGAAPSGTLYVKGSFRFITRGTWTGTIYVKRRENGGDWETFRTYVGSSGAEQNVSWTLKEDSDNVEYYIDSTTGPASAGFRAELSSEDLFHSGIVRFYAYGSPTVISVEVLSRIESTADTVRWAESSWSDYRGWPASITFFENRCIYAGALSASAGSSIDLIDYPSLRTYVAP